MPDKTQTGPHPVPDSREQAGKGPDDKQDPNTHLERRQERNSELTEKAQEDVGRGPGAPKPDPANH